MESERRKEESKTSFDKQADHYDFSYYGRHGREAHKRIIEMLARFDHISVLDVGCGTGNFLLELLKTGKDVALMELTSQKKCSLSPRGGLAGGPT